MQLSGHHLITRIAVRDFAQEALEPLLSGSDRDFGGRPDPAVRLQEAGVSAWGLANQVVRRDVIDFLTYGHWSNFAQKHHFMRRFNGQSPLTAYEEACSWIYDNALAFADASARGWGSFKLAELGSACHAVQDSFAPGHVEREQPGNQAAGAIRYVKLYSGQDKIGHDKGDAGWMTAGGGLSTEGFQAKNATKALLRLVVGHAESALEGTGQLTGWREYRATWLRASSSIARVDEVYDLIERHRSPATPRVPRRLDRRSLARALYDLSRSRTLLVLRVFHRIRDAYRADADVVARQYVDLARNGGFFGAASRDRDDVRKVLIEILESGWTSSEESAAIAFLRSVGPIL